MVALLPETLKIPKMRTNPGSTLYILEIQIRLQALHGGGLHLLQLNILSNTH